MVSNAYAERFVLSIKSECLERMVFFTDAALRRALWAYTGHYHRERNHQGLGNELIERKDVGENGGGEVWCHERLGGVLKYYYRAAA